MTDPVFLLGAPRHGPFNSRAPNVLRSAGEVRDALARHHRARWVVCKADALAYFSITVGGQETRHRVLLLERATTARRELLHAIFRVVIAPADGVRMLPDDELAEVMADEHAEDLFIGGVVDPADKALVLYRGNLDRLVVPLSWFKRRPKGPRPDVKAFAVIDFGQTIQLGEYEAATEAILYEFDDDARRRMKKRVLDQDTSFGGALRRLRMQKGLSRSDFAPLPSKTIARIERGEVDKPQADTLATIAKRLGVKPDQIATY